MSSTFIPAGKEYVVERREGGEWVFHKRGAIPCIATLSQKINQMAIVMGTAIRVLDGDTVVAQGTPIVPGSSATH